MAGILSGSTDEVLLLLLLLFLLLLLLLLWLTAETPTCGYKT
jgi:hypothetical protein